MCCGLRLEAQVGVQVRSAVLSLWARNVSLDTLAGCGVDRSH